MRLGFRQRRGTEKADDSEGVRQSCMEMQGSQSYLTVIVRMLAAMRPPETVAQ